MAAMGQALRPATIHHQAAGNRVMVERLVGSASRMTALAAGMLTVPLLVMTEPLLELWLGNVPNGAATFTRLVCAAYWIGALGSGHLYAIMADGRLGLPTSIATTGTLVGLGVGWLTAAMQWAGAWAIPTWPLALGVVLQSLIIRPFYCRQMLNLSVRRWLSESVVPATSIVVAAGLAALVVRWQIGSTAAGLLVATTVSTLLIGVLAWPFGLTEIERSHLRRLGIVGRNRLQKLRA